MRAHAIQSTLIPRTQRTPLAYIKLVLDKRVESKNGVELSSIHALKPPSPLHPKTNFLLVPQKAVALLLPLGGVGRGGVGWGGVGWGGGGGGAGGKY